MDFVNEVFNNPNLRGAGCRLVLRKTNLQVKDGPLWEVRGLIKGPAGHPNIENGMELLIGDLIIIPKEEYTRPTDTSRIARSSELLLLEPTEWEEDLNDPNINDPNEGLHGRGGIR